MRMGEIIGDTTCEECGILIVKNKKTKTYWVNVYRKINSDGLEYLHYVDHLCFELNPNFTIEESMILIGRQAANYLTTISFTIDEGE